MTDLTRKQERRLNVYDRKYGPRARKLLRAIAKDLRAQGLKVSAPCDGMGDYKWSILACLKGTLDEPHEDDVDITVEMDLSEECDGSDNGVTFSVNICTVGGAILGGLSPYNYTEQCWVSRDDKAAVEERFSLLEQADICGIHTLITR